MTAEEATVFVIGQAEVVLDAPVKQRLEVGSLTIVRVYPSDAMLNSYPQVKLNRNVYAFDSSGQLVWQIQEAPHGGAGEDKAYMNIRVEHGFLVAGNWIGIDYQVAMADGRVSP
ncbi:MAG: hypothetical protein WBW92_11515, partial [Rhodanobacteraceae bacterium]